MFGITFSDEKRRNYYIIVIINQYQVMKGKRKKMSEKQQACGDKCIYLLKLSIIVNWSPGDICKLLCNL